MKAFVAFLKKEVLESVRSGKLIFLGILFLAFGIMNPAIAKLTPWLLEVMSESLAESGMTVTEVKVDALTSWTQFFKNIPMALIVIVLMYGNSFTKEYDKSTLIPILTKGIERYKVVLSKWLVMIFMWSAGYLMCFAVTYGYNQYFWDNSIAKGLASATFNWWLFGVFTLCLTVLWSTVLKSYSSVILATGGCVLALYLMGLFPDFAEYMPTSLMSSAELMAGVKVGKDYIVTVLIASVSSLGFVALSIPAFNKKQL